MHHLCPRGLAVLLAAACMALSPAWALTWQHANAADTNTIALYHFNETSGTNAYDAAGARTLAHTTTNMTSAAAPGWMATPIGRYLLCSNNNYATYSTYNIAINWTNGLTISFWLRTADQAGRTVIAVDLSHGDGYRNQNVITWRPGWSNPYRPAIHDTDLSFDTTPGLNTKLLNGQWHHIGVTWDPADTTARFYLDNVLITNWPAAGGHDVALLCNLRVGAGLQDPAQCYVGDVDELLVQNSVITDFSDGYGSGPTNPVLAVVPATLTFSGDETTATFQIVNAGMGTLQWTNTLAPGAAWLSATPPLGANRTTITVAVDRTGLAYGSYTGRIEVTANGEIPQETMTIYLNYAPPQLAVSPLILDFGGDGTSMPVAVWNTGMGTVTLSAATNAAWLAVAPAAGTAGAASTTALVTVNRAMLLAYAVYTGTVTFIPALGATQTVAAIVSTYPTTGNALLQIHATRPGQTALACVRYGQEYWRIATDAQGLFQARVPIDAQLVARDDRGREFTQEIMKYEPAYRFLSYLSDTNQVTGNAYMPQSIQDFADLVSTMRWEFPMGCQLSASFMYTNLVGDGVISNISIITAPPAFPGNTNTEVALFMVDKSQVQGGDTLNFACIYRQPLGAKPSENLVFELDGWNPDMPSAYNPVEYIGGQSGTSGYTDLGGGFYARTGAITVPTWVSNKATTVAGVVACALVRQTVGGRAWYEEMYLKIPVGPTRRQLLVSAVWDGLAGAWGDTGVGPYNFYRASTHFQNRYADYRSMAISFMLNGQPVTLCPTNVTAHCADADDAQFYEQFYYDAQCEPQYRNIPCRDSVRAQPAWPDFSAVALCDITADPVPPIAVAMEPRADQSFARKDLVQLYWHVEDVASGAANATIIVDGEPVAEHTTQNPIQLDLVPGRHLWYVIGWDAAGNCATSSVNSLMVESPEPNGLALTLLSVAMGVARGHVRIGK